MAVHNGGSIDTNQEQILALTTKINANNTDLNSILATINNLPSANSGTTEDLSTELTEQDTLIATQETTIDNIISALEGKANGGSSGGLQKESLTVNINVDASMMYGDSFFYIYYLEYYSEYDSIETNYRQISTSCNFTLESVMKGSMICMVASELTNGMIGVEPSLDSTTVYAQYGSVVFVQINESETLNIEGQIFG